VRYKSVLSLPRWVVSIILGRVSRCLVSVIELESSVFLSRLCVMSGAEGMCVVSGFLLVVLNRCFPKAGVNPSTLKNYYNNFDPSMFLVQTPICMLLISVVRNC
jgi:hypothetical protein